MATAISSIALITKYSTQGYDKVYKAEATSSVLSKKSSMIQFTGAKTVKVAKMQFGGLTNYYPNNFGDSRREFSPTDPGYGSSMVGITWEEHTLSMDRAASYAIEEFDNEESGELVIGNAVTEINRTVIVPEVDAYCWSTIYKNAGKVVTGAVAKENSLEALNAGLLWEQENEVPDANQVILMSPAYANLLRNNNKELTHFMTPGSFRTDVSFSMSKYEGRDIVIVPPARFMSDYDFSGEGFTPTSTAVAIDFIIMPKDGATHVTKFQKVRILSGDVATAMTKMDGYVLLARIYHDVFVFDNKKVAIYAHSGSGATTYASDAGNGITNLSGAVYTTTNKAGKKVVERIVTLPGDRFATVGVYSGATAKAGTEVTASDFLPLRVGDEVASDAAVWVIDSTNKLVIAATVK